MCFFVCVCIADMMSFLRELSVKLKCVKECEVTGRFLSVIRQFSNGLKGAV